MKAEEDRRDYQAWGSGKGNWVSSHNQKDTEPKREATLVQLAPVATAQTEVKEKILTNTQHEVQAELRKEAEKELVKPTALNDNTKDAEPQNVQLTK